MQVVSTYMTQILVRGPGSLNPWRGLERQAKPLLCPRPVYYPFPL